MSPTSSKNVIGNKVTIKVMGMNVAQSQKKFAQCPTVKKVANKNLSLRIEKPLVFEGYRCTPRVLTGGEGTVEPQKVAYNCLFRGADTATEIVLKFTVTYNTVPEPSSAIPLVIGLSGVAWLRRRSRP